MGSCSSEEAENVVEKESLILCHVKLVLKGAFWKTLCSLISTLFVKSFVSNLLGIVVLIPE
jgi:hypothetical protein